MKRRIAILTLLVLAMSASADAGWGRRYRNGGVVYQGWNAPRVRHVTPTRMATVPQSVRYTRPMTIPNYAPQRTAPRTPVQSPFPPPMI